MKLQRLKVEQLRQFRQPLEIRSFNPGINLFSGPNESGKSTLVRAIRAAFFERYKSTSAGDLQPWGDTSASPAIALEFSWEGQHWKLSKSFLKHKRCDLDIDGQLFSGEEAEEKLAQLLGYQFAARGASKAEHWGIPGLLWIEQGSVQEIQAPVQNAGNYLESALGESLGELASTAGDELVNQVERARAQLLTATGRPTGDYAEIQKQHTQCQQALAALEADIVTYRQQVDRLGALQEQQMQDTSRPWESWHEKAKQAQRQLDEVQSWIQTQETDKKSLQHADQQQQLWQEQLAAFATQHQELQQRAERKQQTQQTRDTLQARRSAVEAQREQAEKHYQQAESLLKQARHFEQYATLSGEQVQLEQELAQLHSKLERCNQLQVGLLAQRSQLQSNKIDAQALKQLRALNQVCSELQAAQRAVATRLQYQLLPGQALQVGEETLAGQGERHLLEAVDIRIKGVGTLHIQPGGEDTAELARRWQSAHDKFITLLDKLHAADLNEAENLADQHQMLLQDIKQGEFELNNLAPAGTDELRAQQTLKRQRHEQVKQALIQLGPTPTQRITISTAEQQLEAADQQLKRAAEAATNFEKELSLAQQAAISAQQEWQRLEQNLHLPNHQQREQQVQTQLKALQEQTAHLKNTITTRQQQIDAARPDILRLDVKRYTQTAITMEQEAGQRKLELTALQSRLEALGAAGLEEQHAEQAQQFEYLDRRHNELTRRALALDFLLGLLKEKQAALTQRIQAPLQQHINHYLPLLFPQAELKVDARLVPEQLVRHTPGQGQTHEDLAALSFGAREQMGLISRLAYADLLKEAGRPTLIILDDALVHSDAQRLAQMKRILFDAGQRHQILLFTCHPENWRDLGVAAVSMQALAH